MKNLKEINYMWLKFLHNIGLTNLSHKQIELFLNRNKDETAIKDLSEFKKNKISPVYNLNYQEQAINEKYIKIIKKIAYQYKLKVQFSFEIDDLISAGLLGLMKAYESNKENMNFDQYAEYEIRYSIINFIRSNDIVYLYSHRHRKKIQEIDTATEFLDQKLGRPATDTDICDYLNIDLKEYEKLKTIFMLNKQISIDDLFQNGENDFEENDNETIQDEIEKIELKNILNDLMNTLSKKEKMVISLYFYKGKTFKKISEIMNIPISNVYQIKQKAILDLKSKLEQFGF